MAKKKVEAPDLIARYASAVPLPDGGFGIVMIDSKGVVYTLQQEGWKRMDMKEAS